MSSPESNSGRSSPDLSDLELVKSIQVLSDGLYCRQKDQTLCLVT